MNATVLEQWLAREEEVRTLHARPPASGLTEPLPEPLPDPLPDPEWARTHTGMELMQAMMQGRYAAPSIGRTMAFLLVELDSGKAVFQGTPGPAYFNPMGAVHGGWYATLLDSALGCAIHTLMPAGRAYTTAELSVNIVKAISPKVQRVRAMGEVLHCGRQLATAQARLVGPDGTLYAHATSTCLVFEIPTQSTK